MKVFIRPLQEDDSLISYAWRNDPQVWEFTGSQPTMHVTQKIELAWIKEALTRQDEQRFAICLSDTQEYIGNVQLTHISGMDAEFHIFIGKRQIHGQGIGAQATRLILDYAQNSLGLRQVYLLVNPSNIFAIRMYEKCGFSLSASNETQLTYVRKLQPCK